MKRNEVVLDGRVVKRGVLRYTPAGTPALNLRLGHRSMQVEAGSSCEVRCEIDAVALGDMALRLSALQVDRGLQVSGFLAQRRIGARNLVLHVVSAEPLATGGRERTQGD